MNQQAKAPQSSAGESVIVGTRAPVETPINTTTQRVLITHKGQERVLVGYVCHYPLGWRFLPLSQRMPSRKHWPTPEDALRGRVKNYTLEPAAQSLSQRSNQVSKCRHERLVKVPLNSLGAFRIQCEDCGQPITYRHQRSPLVAARVKQLSSVEGAIK